MKYIIFIITLMISHGVSATIDFFIIKNLEGNKIKVTRKEMEELPQYSITTSTNFTPKSEFVGVKFKDIINKYSLHGSKVRAYSLDDYSFTLPIDEMKNYNVLIAYKKDGEYMSISELGPFSIIYPKDNFPELNNLSVNAKTVWQVKLLEVK